MAKRKTDRRRGKARELAKAKKGPRAKDKKAAEDLLKNREATKNAADEAEVRANFFRKLLGPVWDDLCTMIRLVRAYGAGDYRKVAWHTIVMIVGAIIYFLSPIDLIPDWIPVVGMLDDVAVLGFAAKVAHDDLEAFRKWEGRRKSGSAAAVRT